MIKKFIWWHLPRKLAHAIRYYRQSGRKINWKNPMLYDEMLHFLMATKYDESYGVYADKYAVRDYVKECGLGDLLVPLYGVYENADEIDFTKLPEKYVLMTNHASGEAFYYICKDNSKANVDEIRCKFNKALKIKFSRQSLEYQYEKIPPKILCEELLEDEKQEHIDDYKVVCVNGAPQKILVCTERDKGRDYYSTNWEYLDHVYEEYKSGQLMPKPECLSQMLDAAAKLSKPFPLARIDFYIVNGKLYFSEITLTPSAGFHSNLNERGQREWKDLVK